MNPQLFAFLAAGGTGTRLDGLRVRPDAGLELAPSAAGRRPTGILEAGPLDAGEDGRWWRVVVQAQTPPATRVTLETATGITAAATPAWRPAAALDLLVEGERFLWVRLTLEAEQPSGPATPVVSEVRAETEPDSYLDHLPRIYARDDATGFLRRLLALAQSSLGDLQATVDLLGRSFNAATASPDTLAWLAGWQAYDAPPELLRGDDPERLRALLADLPELYEQRGTPRGIVRAVDAQTGVRPALFEHFRHRSGWVLDAAGALAVDTALAGSAPDGIVLDTSIVGTGTVEDPQTYGRGMFGDTAHRFSAVVPAGRLTHSQRQRVAEVIAAEKPAHTEHHVCFAGPRFRVGVQAAVGVDTIVGRSLAQIELT